MEKGTTYTYISDGAISPENYLKIQNPKGKIAKHKRKARKTFFFQFTADWSGGSFLFYSNISFISSDPYFYPLTQGLGQGMDSETSLSHQC